MDCLHCAKREDVIWQTPLWRIVTPPLGFRGDCYWLIESKRHLRYQDSLTTLERETLRSLMRHASRLAREETGTSRITFIPSSPEKDAHLYWCLCAYTETTPSSRQAFAGR